MPIFFQRLKILKCSDMTMRLRYIFDLSPSESQKDQHIEILYQWQPTEEDGPINVEGSHLSLQMPNTIKRKKKANAVKRRARIRTSTPIPS